MDDEDMTDELTQPQKPISTLSDSNKKRKRIGQFAAILASRTRPSSDTSYKSMSCKSTEQVPTSSSTGNNTQCSIFGLSIQSDKPKDGRKCSSCMNCVNDSSDSVFSQIGRILVGMGVNNSDTTDCIIYAFICFLIRKRSENLCAAAIAGLCRKMSARRIIIGVDTSLFGSGTKRESYGSQ